jgi:hypothetical protein
VDRRVEGGKEGERQEIEVLVGFPDNSTPIRTTRPRPVYSFVPLYCQCFFKKFGKIFTFLVITNKKSNKKIKINEISLCIPVSRQYRD